MDEFITEIKEISSKMVLIYVNDAPSFALYKNEPEKLGIKAGECTPDGFFSIDSCRCLGACGLAPVMTVDGEVYGKCTPESAVKIIDSYYEEV